MELILLVLALLIGGAIALYLGVAVLIFVIGLIGPIGAVLLAIILFGGDDC
jgi:hypothetical protein